MKVAVLLATYHPNFQFFIEQLKSLDEQTYENTIIYVCDDSGDSRQFELITELVEKTLVKKEFYILKNEKNMGSNYTFAFLTKVAEADLFCYCDQDDIWREDKIEILMKYFIEDTSIKLMYTDLILINEKNEVISQSFEASQRRLNHVFGEGEEVFSRLIRQNSVTGCAMMIDAHIAKQALPFPKQTVYVHDHWLTIFASSKGKIGYHRENLVFYRIHSSNQIGTSILKGINNKEVYLEKKLNVESNRVEVLKQMEFCLIKENKLAVSDYELFVKLRKKIFTNIFKIKFNEVIFLLKKDKQLVFFEFIISILPNPLVKKVLSLVKKV